jgi:hypothetical protein
MLPSACQTAAISLVAEQPPTIGYIDRDLVNVLDRNGASMGSEFLSRLLARTCVGVLLASGSAGALAADSSEPKTGRLWSPCLEWTIQNRTWIGNAFDVRASAEFVHEETGEIRHTEMFYAGDNVWAFRFTGTRSGRWTFTTSSEDDQLRGHTGTAVIEPAQGRTHGFLKNFGNKWGWEGTEQPFVPQLVMWDYLVGDNCPRTFHNNAALVEQKISQAMVDRGFHGFHVPVLGGRWFEIDSDSDRVMLSMVNPDVRTFEALELLITMTHEAGGFVHIWPWGDHQRSQTPRSLDGGINGVVDRRLQRYIAARLGPLPGWSMGYGFDLDEWVSARQVKQWRDAMHRMMGWHHFLGGRPAGPNQGVDHSVDAKWNVGLDYSSYEHHRPTYEVYLAALNAIPTQPVMSEDRFRIRQSRYREKDYDESMTRRGLYHATMAGGVANIWGIHPDLEPGGLHRNEDDLRTYFTFFDGHRRFLADMKPANHLSRDEDTRVLQSLQAQSLVVYREDADSIQIDLSTVAEPLYVIAVDTKKAYAEIELGQLDAKQQLIRLPRRSDWVLGLGRFGR